MRSVEGRGNIVVNGRVFIRNKGRFVVDGKVVVNSGKNYNVIGGDSRANFMIGDNALLRMGENVGISNSTIVCSKEIVIESNVLIGGGCKIYDSDFHSTDYQKRIDAFVCNKKDIYAKVRPVRIKDGAWIGGHSIILKGVTIGERSIVGAGSVVSKDVPDYEIWAGSPIKYMGSIDQKI